VALDYWITPERIGGLGMLLGVVGPLRRELPDRLLIVT
jgi:hypothetical protein